MIARHGGRRGGPDPHSLLGKIEELLRKIGRAASRMEELTGELELHLGELLEAFRREENCVPAPLPEAKGDLPERERTSESGGQKSSNRTSL